MDRKEFRYPRYLGERIRSARINLGLNQEQLADAIEVPRPAISQIESGKRAVDSMELVSLSRALQKPISFFLDPPVEETKDDPVKVLFRADGVTENDKPVLDDVLALAKDYTLLEELLELPPSGALPAWKTDMNSRWDAIVDGERCAAALRAQLNIGVAPVKDLDTILESIGIKVLTRSLVDSKVWGFSLTSKQWGHCIFVNTNCAIDRQRFTMAHELGHLITDRDHSATVYMAKQSLGEKDDKKTLSEVRANAFAAALLVPDLAVKQILATLGISDGNQLTTVTIDYLRNTFGVSPEAMLWRLVNLKWITKDDRPRLTAVTKLEEHGKPSLPNESLPDRYRNLAFEAYRNAKISIGKLAELLRVDMYEARKLVKELRIQQTPA